MIVLDEQIGNAPSLRAAVAHWYPSKVISIHELRPYGRIEDAEIPDYLLQLKQPTFVTINYRDFWLRPLVHVRYCIICFKLRQDEALFVLPQRLREVFRLPEFRTKRLRMGKVVSVTAEDITVYR